MTPPVQTIDLFPILDEKLISLLRTLSAEDWTKPTRAKLWTVKDIAAHLLDGNIRTISMSRDKYFGETPPSISGYRELVSWLNQLNKIWVDAARRLSPTVLVDFLEITGKQYSEYLRTLDPFAEAIFSVDWAGEKTSLNWFHIAREYTEKWHHQQQIREALNQHGILTDRLYHPVLSTFLRGLPHAYRELHIRPVTISIRIDGAGGGTWSLSNQTGNWELAEEAHLADAQISLTSDDAWKLFTKGLTSDEAKQVVNVTGKTSLGDPFKSLIAVMA